MDGRDPLIYRQYGEKSLVADKLAIDAYIALYTNPWEPEFFSRLEDGTPASSPMGFESIYGDPEGDTDSTAGIWMLCVRADRLWNKRLGTLRLTDAPDGELTLSIR